jgi:hypothetical protein
MLLAVSLAIVGLIWTTKWRAAVSVALLLQAVLLAHMEQALYLLPAASTPEPTRFLSLHTQRSQFSVLLIDRAPDAYPGYLVAITSLVGTVAAFRLLDAQVETVMQPPNSLTGSLRVFRVLMMAGGCASAANQRRSGVASGMLTHRQTRPARLTYRRTHRCCQSCLPCTIASLGVCPQGPIVNMFLLSLVASAPFVLHSNFKPPTFLQARPSLRSVPNRRSD